ATLTQTVNQPSASITGQVFNDLNFNGTRDAGEPGLPGWTLYVDSNNNGTLDAGEPSTITDTNGTYTFNLAPGTYRIREVPQAGWVQTTANPADIALGSGSAITGVQFGNFRSAVNPGVKLGTNFGGLVYPTSNAFVGWVPPDPQIAVGPSYIVEVV